MFNDYTNTLSEFSQYDNLLAVDIDGSGSMWISQLHPFGLPAHGV